ncbi:sensor domain-containing diguanylate cyclase [Evansella cellulosilytica]|uniref:Diguanylate cyclase with PAS/PAC sensor n=1 Tax=Evansella cellulosilytica (strain ATCC 21833 / DSM 2522 / FERM P-1141 / JCM 9156 / N-4) TaxID=649639 RepID=E6TUR5_EVAC2|nr:sensor domain-containing diguanylate cyclase [Evansella cellulosilytica]ADU32067.1 diguanylate cyclase with PAS/PAC sensor [Evansella cellulosilytica DSM 2522]
MFIFLFLVSFIPFLIMFALACEVYYRSKKSNFHRLTALLIIFLSMLFLTDALKYFLPPREALILLLFKYYCVFFIMTLGIYFFRYISKIRLSGWWHALFLFPLFGAVIMTFMLPFDPITFNEVSNVQTEMFSLPFVVLLLFCTIIAFIFNIYFLYKGYKKSKEVNISKTYVSRLQLILKGNIITTIAIILLNIIVFTAEHHGIILAFLSPYAVLIWAYTVRYSMFKYDLLESSSRKYELLFKMSTNGILILNDKAKIVDVNPTFLKMLGYTKMDVYHLPLSSFLIEKSPIDFQYNYEAAYPVSDQLHMEVTLRARNGEKVTAEMFSDYIDIDEKKHSFLIFRDITHQKTYEEKLRFLAYHDSLTQLGNRVLFYEKFKELDKTLNFNQQQLAVILLDLDRFKEINDSYGHSAGDAVLKNVSSQILQLLPEIAYGFRMGGDEFAILLPTTTQKELLEIVETLIANIRKPIQIQEKKVIVSTSVGISLANEDGLDPDTLLNNADKAMYEAKNKDRQTGTVLINQG